MEVETASRTIRFKLNGQACSIASNPVTRTSDVLREELGLTGTKVGCDAGDCGACTILIDGEQRFACLTAAGQLEGCDVHTVEGLAKDGKLSPLQEAFHRYGAAQCGICTPGMLMAAQSLLNVKPNPSREEVEDALGGVLCRCTGYSKIVAAVLEASGTETQELPADADSGFGSRTRKVDGEPKLLGTEIYGADKAPDDSLWMRVVRSPHPRATFVLPSPEKIIEENPGLMRILTWQDVPGNNGFGIYPHIKDQPVLAKDQVRYRGEAVAALIGDRKSIEAITEDDLGIEWIPQNAIESYESALEGKISPVQEIHEDNLLARGFLKKGNAESVYEQSLIKAQGTWETSYVEHAYIEPEAGYAVKRGQRLELFVSTQTPYMDRDEVAQVLGIGPDQVRIIPSAVGGGFGGKLDCSVQPLLAVAAWILEKPIRCTFTRPESLASSTKRHPAKMKASASCDKDGTLTSLSFEGDFNTGAYASWGPTVADRVPIHCSGPYFIPNILAKTRALLTNGPPSGAFRGFGVPQSAIAHEALMDSLAEQTGIDPLEFRLKNALRKGQRTGSGQLLENSAGQAECLQALQTRWQEWRKASAEFNKHSEIIKRGVGIGCCWYGCGNTSMSNPSTMHVGINSEGTITLYNGAMDIGQGANTIMIQICAEALGLPASSFQFIMGDTDLTADAGKTSASRQAFVSGRASQLAGEHLRAQIIHLAEAEEDANLRLDGSTLWVQDKNGEHSILLSDLLPRTKGDVLVGEGTFDPPTTKLDENGQGSPYATYGFGAHIAEVEVDQKLGTTRVLRLAAAHDVGKTVNPTQVEGQIQGGVAQGLGMALMEEYVQGVTENLHDYLIPTVGDMPDIEILLIEDPEPLGPFGAKGIGEHALIPTAPAILGGIRQATGVSIHRIPATPDRVLQAIKQKGMQA
ncbi:MAG: molybdopterin-dependent oxidoreductase [bacterium]